MKCMQIASNRSHAAAIVSLAFMSARVGVAFIISAFLKPGALDCLLKHGVGIWSFAYARNLRLVSHCVLFFSVPHLLLRSGL